MRVSMKDVARAAQVSQAAVSRVLNNNGYVSDEKRVRVLRAIEKLGYRPNALARGLVRNQSRTIGLCLPYLNTPFISSLMEGVEAESEKHGYDVFICHTKEDPGVEERAVARMLERQVEGMLVVPVLGNRNDFATLLNAVPTLILLRKPRRITRNLVCANDYRAAKQSLGYLLDNGHRRIGFLKGPPRVSTIRERWRAISDLLKSRGIRQDPDLVAATSFDYQESYEAAMRLLAMKKRPTAIYALHYWGAAALLKAVNDLRLRTPEDVSLVFYELFEEWNYMTNMSVASNIFPASEMGRVAVARLHGLIRRGDLFLPENVVVEQEFHAHPSVRKIR